MRKQDVHRKMLALSKVSVCVALLGLLTAIIIGILSIRGSKHPAQQPPTVKTIIVHTQDKAASQPNQTAAPVEKASSPAHGAQATQAPSKAAEPVQAVQPKEGTGSSTTTPTAPAKRLHSKSRKPPKESDSSK